MSANVFRAPVATPFVDYLVDAGYDVWLETWRASIDLPRVDWTLDRGAAWDHPAAVRKVVEETGQREIKAVVHCQGSTSFVMSAVAGLVPEVKTVVSNAVSIHPVVPALSRLKISLMTPLVANVLRWRFVSPLWGVSAPGLLPKAMAAFVRTTHRECDNGVCRMASFVYGTGRPALWRHENLNAQTHYWIRQEFADCPLAFFQQMRRSVKAGHVMAAEDLPQLPLSEFGAPGQTARTDARFAFFAGGKSRVFAPESQKRTFEWLDAQKPRFHSFERLENYSHLDVFIGKNAARDVYPKLVGALGD